MSRSDSGATMPSIRDCSSVSSWLLRTGSRSSQGITAGAYSVSTVSAVTLTGQILPPRCAPEHSFPDIEPAMSS